MASTVRVNRRAHNVRARHGHVRCPDAPPSGAGCSAMARGPPPAEGRGRESARTGSRTRRAQFAREGPKGEGPTGEGPTGASEDGPMAGAGEGPTEGAGDGPTVG